MTDAATPPLDHDAPAPDAGRQAWARGVIERHVAVEEELAQAGLRLALAIEQGATQAVAEGRPVDKDAAMAFSRVSRAVRMTGLLQAKLIRDLEKAAKAAAEDGAEDAEDAGLDEPAYRHKFRVERIVERLIKAQHSDEDEVDRLAVETGERLDDEDLYGDVLQRPIGELVSLLCRDLNLKPDWDRLAQEAWAREEIASGAPNSPFNNLSSARAPPFAAASGGEDPLAERSEERVGVGAGHLHPPFNTPPAPPLAWSG